jgi:hypothetical protein
LREKGFRVDPVSEDAIALAFEDHAWRSVIDIGRGAARGTMCVYGWRDVLGYDWELAYTIPADQWPEWQRRLASLG